MGFIALVKDAVWLDDLSDPFLLFDHSSQSKPWDTTLAHPSHLSSMPQGCNLEAED